MSKAIINELPVIVGQLAGMLARLAAAKHGIHAQDTMSSAIGVAANVIATSLFENAFPEWYPNAQGLPEALVRIGIGLALIANKAIGKYDPDKARYDPAYAYNYAYQVAEVNALALLISGAVSGGLMLAGPTNGEGQLLSFGENFGGKSLLMGYAKAVPGVRCKALFIIQTPRTR